MQYFINPHSLQHQQMDFRCEEKKDGDRLYEPGTGIDGISMDGEGAFKACMWFSVVVQESCVICWRVKFLKVEEEKKNTDKTCTRFGLKQTRNGFYSEDQVSIKSTYPGRT